MQAVNQRRMRASLSGLAGLAATWLVPVLVAAQAVPPDVAEHPHPTFAWTNVLLGAFVNFGLLVFLFVWFGRKKLGPFLMNRRKVVEDGLAEAARLTEQAQAAHAQYTQKLASLNDELVKIRAELQTAGEEEKQRMIAEAEARAATMRRDAELLIEQQMAELRASVTRDVVNAAVQAARDALVGAVNPADQERLAQNYLAELRGALGRTENASSQASRAVLPQEGRA